MQGEIAATVMEDMVRLTKEDIALTLGYHYSTIYLPRSTEFPGGLLVEESQVAFLGGEVPKLTLVYEGTQKAVYYNGLDPYQAGDVTFDIWLVDNRAGVGYEQLEVSDAFQLEAESILSTLRQFTPAQAAPVTELKSEGSEYFLTFESCFDLDEGMQVAADEAACDFSIAKAANSLNIDFKPQAPAAFGFDGVFAQQPQVSQCAGLSVLSSGAETIAPLDAYYVCYQTNAGRYGYLLFRGLTSDGHHVRLADVHRFRPAPAGGYAGRGDHLKRCHRAGWYGLRAGGELRKNLAVGEYRHNYLDNRIRHPFQGRQPAERTL